MRSGREAAAESASQDGSAHDPDSSTAFALGWELASLLRSTPFEKEDDTGTPATGSGLMRLSSLEPRMRAELAVDLIEADLRKLGPRLAQAKEVDLGLIADLRTMIEKTGGRIEAAVGNLHREVLFVLVAADAGLGRAYELGYELADICLEPHDLPSLEGAFGVQATAVKDRLADLSSSFPPHAGRAVVLSLRAWEAWAAEPTLKGRPLSWDNDGAGVEDALRRQGMLWRDLLAGDKKGQDMLDTGHYIQAASSLVATMVPTVWRFARPLWRPLGLLFLSLVAGIAILVLAPSSARALGTVLAVAGAIGITGAGARARMAEVTGELQSQLWGAELDRAIAEAVLVGPDGWDARVEDIHVPASGAAPQVSTNIETLSRFRSAVGSGSPDEIAKLLAPDAEFVLPDGDRARGAKAVAKWLCQEPQATQIAGEPDEVEAVAPGVIVSRFGKRAAVWRVRERKIRWRQGFADAAAAQEMARTLGPRA